MRHVSRRSYLIVGNAHLGTRRIRAHRSEKPLARLPEQPRGADDIVPRIKQPHRSFASQLARGVEGQRICFVVFVVWPLQLAVKNVVGRDVNERDSKLCSLKRKVARTARVHGVCLVPARLGAIHVVERGSVYNEVGPVAPQDFMYRRQLSYIERVVIQRNKLMTYERIVEAGAKLPQAACD